MVQRKVISAFIVYNYNPNKYSMCTFTFLISSISFAVTELGHKLLYYGIAVLETQLKNGKAIMKATSKCPFLKVALFKI